MATTNIAFCNVGVMTYGNSVPAAIGEGVVSEDITPSASNQQSAAATRDYARVATDTAIYVAIGSSPNASTSTTARFYIPANGVEYFKVQAGNKVAVITA